MSSATLYENPRCYAGKLGGCSDVMSREDWLTKSVLDKIRNRGSRKTISVSGLWWQKPGAREDLGTSAIRSWTLCKVHNYALSAIDATGGRLFESAIQLADHIGQGGRLAGELVVDGHTIERWLLKILCGSLAAKQYRDERRGKNVGIRPPLSWIEFLYNRRPWPDDIGIYFDGVVGSFRLGSPTLEGEPVIYRQRICGYRLSLCGIRFSLLMEPLWPGALKTSDAIHRPNRILFVSDEGDSDGFALVLSGNAFVIKARAIPAWN